MSFNLVSKKPITSSLRHTCLINKSKLWNGKPLNVLNLILHKKYTGRNRLGKLILYTRTSRFHKKKYRLINFKYYNFGIPSYIHRIEYDPNRSSFISLNVFKNGIICYYLLSSNTKIGDFINSLYYIPNKYLYNNGDVLYLRLVPEGSMINNIEKIKMGGSQYTRSAGCYSIMIRKYFDLNKCIIKLKSGFYKILSMSCKSTLGSISNKWYSFTNYGKAGRSRWLGIKPNVRGVAMNPVDHPHGGGEGKKSKKASPRSPWGKMFKWKKTSKFFKYYSSKISRDRI